MSSPITQRNVTSQFGSSGLQSLRVFRYDSTGYGLLTEEDDYDYASGTPTTILRKVLTGYASLGNGIVGMPSSVTVEDGGGNIKAQTTYYYDQSGVSASSGTPQHVSVTGSRGNVTTISSLVAGSTTLSKTFTYWDTGMPNTATDVNLGVTTNSYSGASCGNAFPTQVTEAVTSLTKLFAWNCVGGVLTSVTDENGKATTFVYANDPYYWRPDSVADPTGATTNFCYGVLNGGTCTRNVTQVESYLNFNGATSSVDVLSTVDGLGRQILRQTRQSPSSSYFDTVETDYDALGRPIKVSLPFNASAGGTNSSAAGTSTQYDALNRTKAVTDSGGGNTSYDYTSANNDVLVTIPAPSGENPKKRQLEYDGLGRLTSVCELTSGTQSGTCGQTTARTGYWTKYTFDVLGDLTGVTQNTQPNGTAQTRTYAYDELGRLTSETNPEIGPSSGPAAINYTYDSDSTCGITSNGDLVKKVDPQGDTVCFSYDALHRNTSVTYSGGYASATPNKYFVYDTATINGVQMTNVKARLAEAYTGSSKTTDIGFSYTVRGEVSDVYESTPHSSGYYHLTQTYWAHGTPSQLSGLPSLPTIYHGASSGAGLDGEGRVTQVTASSGQNPVTGVNYNPYGNPPQTTVTFGSGDSDVFNYDPNTLRMTQYQFNVNGQSDKGTLTWNANATLQQLAIADAFNSSDNQSCTYSYDDLMRLASANCGSVQAYTYSYDPFGNISKVGNPGYSFQPVYSSTTRNQISSVGGLSASYDSNGNVLNDRVHTYTWDSDGNSISVDSVGATYDALDRMVEQNRSGAYTEIVYSPTGGKLALMSAQSMQKAFVALPGQAMAVYTSTGLDHYRHSDWLGSARLTSTPSRTVSSTVAYAPFGETYAQSGTTDLSFTGMNQDTTTSGATGDYDFPYREYSTQGRWPSPDPAGRTATNPMNPQSWNRYAYVLNNPLSNVDPTGLWCQFPGGVTEGGDPTSCQGEGGTWVDPSVPSQYSADYNGTPPSGPSLITSVSSGGQTLWWGCSGPSGVVNKATNCGYQFGDEQKSIPGWYPSEVLAPEVCNTTSDCSNIATALQDPNYQQLITYTSTDQYGTSINTTAEGLWTSFFSAMGISYFGGFPAFQPISRPGSATSCAQAAAALTRYIKQHPGMPPPHTLIQALNSCASSP